MIYPYRLTVNGPRPLKKRWYKPVKMMYFKGKIKKDKK